MYIAIDLALSEQSHGMYDIFELFHKAQIISIKELVKGHT